MVGVFCRDEGGTMIRAAFFDIDGTLLSFKTHKTPESTKRALATLREKGILTIVSSGRPTYQLPPCIKTGFDAYITLSGQLCYDADGVFRSNPISKTGVASVVEQVKSGCYEALVLQGDRAFCSKLTDDVAEVARAAGLVYEPDDIDRTFDAPVYQFCAFLDQDREHIITDAIPDVATTRWTHLFCDIMPADGGKIHGVRAAFERYGISPQEAIAFGDGENDLSMFEAVGTGVAMGNAWDTVKERADYVTTSVDDDGIWKACEHFGLL